MYYNVLMVITDIMRNHYYSLNDFKTNDKVYLNINHRYNYLILQHNKRDFTQY